MGNKLPTIKLGTVRKCMQTIYDSKFPFHTTWSSQSIVRTPFGVPLARFNTTLPTCELCLLILHIFWLTYTKNPLSCISKKIPTPKQSLETLAIWAWLCKLWVEVASNSSTFVLHLKTKCASNKQSLIFPGGQSEHIGLVMCAAWWQHSQVLGNEFVWRTWSGQLWQSGNVKGVHGWLSSCHRCGESKRYVTYIQYIRALSSDILCWCISFLFLMQSLWMDIAYSLYQICKQSLPSGYAACSESNDIS